MKVFCMLVFFFAPMFAFCESINGCFSGNPVWCYVYEQFDKTYEYDAEDNPVGVTYFHVDQQFSYVCPTCETEIEGKKYILLSEIFLPSLDDEEFVLYTLPVREEDGRIYSITDSVYRLEERLHIGPTLYMPYVTEDNECVLYDFTIDQDEYICADHDLGKVTGKDNVALCDGTVCPALNTQYNGKLLEGIGYTRCFSFIHPLARVASHIGGVNGRKLNAFYRNRQLIYKAPGDADVPCSVETYSSVDEVRNHLEGYTFDPNIGRVQEYISKLFPSETGVESVDSERIANITYDLTGRQTTALHKGIFISRGRKVVR